MRKTRLSDGTWKVEYRVYGRMVEKKGELAAPILTVVTRTGSPEELARGFTEEIRDAADKGDVGRLMSLASAFLDDWKDYMSGVDLYDYGIPEQEPEVEELIRGTLGSEKEETPLSAEEAALEIEKGITGPNLGE